MPSNTGEPITLNGQHVLQERMAVDKKAGIIEETKNTISKDISQLQEMLGYDQSLTRYSKETPLGTFLEDSKVAFRNGVDKELRRVEKMKKVPSINLFETMSLKCNPN